MLSLDKSFGIRFVYVAAPPELAHLAVYVYDLSGESPLPIHESKYRHPFSVRNEYGFTGMQSAYRSDGDELSYFCSWEGR
jgi:hypothetical protein